MDHACDPKWAKKTKHMASVIRCARCGRIVHGDGTMGNPWRCAPVPKWDGRE